MRKLLVHLSVMIALVGVRYEARGQCDVELYVSSDFGHEVFRYDGATGALRDVFVPVSSNGTLDQPHGIIARESDVLVASFGTDEVLRFDRMTGNLLGVFISSASGLDAPVYMRYGPDGNIYIASQLSDEILRFTPDGTLIDAFITAGSGGLDGPSGFAFGPDGRLYVAGRYSANVLAYNGSTGAFEAELLSSADGLTNGDTFGLNFAGNGDLYVASNGQVFRYHVATDTVVATIPMAFPIGIETAPNGEIVVATGNNLRFIAADNTVGSPFLSGGAINLLNFFHFAPMVPNQLGDADCDGDVDLADHQRFADCMTGPLGPSGFLPAYCLPALDHDLDGDIDLLDFAVLLLN
jgi:streptogramin lyase